MLNAHCEVEHENIEHKNEIARTAKDKKSDKIIKKDRCTYLGNETRTESTRTESTRTAEKEGQLKYEQRPTVDERQEEHNNKIRTSAREQPTRRINALTLGTK